MNIRFYNAKILLTKEDHSFEIIQGELWVQGDSIAYIGNGSDASAMEETWDRQIDAEGNLLMPGFKNGHTHTSMVFLRSYADDLPLQDWLFQQVFPKEDQLTEQIVYDLDILGIMEYLTSGITSNFDMYYFPQVNAKASTDCGFRTVQVQGINDFGPTLEVMEENYLRVNEYSDLTSMYLGIHAEYTTSKELMGKVARMAEKYKSPIYAHNSETAKEVAECNERYGMTPTQIMNEMGLFAYGGGGYHCVYMDDKDIEIFKEKNLSVVTNPGSNLKLASGIAPVKRFVEEGINVAIGTDGAASNNALDLFREIYLTATLAKVREMDAECVSADEVLYMATAGGAKAMGLPDCDRLEAGKKADIIMIDLQQPNMQPENNIVKNIVYSGSKQNVKMTMVNGRVLYENGIYHIGFDPSEVYSRANEIIRGMK